jgi:predicted nucleic acid-binding protein
VSPRAFVDAAVLAQAHDTTAGVRHELARALVERLWNERSGALGAEVLRQLWSALREEAGQPLDAQEVRQILADYALWRVVPTGPDSLLEALELQARHGLSQRDALMLQGAIAAGAELLYTERLEHGRVYAGVRVVNPYLRPAPRPDAAPRS